MDTFDHNYWGFSILNNDQLPSTTNITIVIFQCIVYSNVGRVHLHRNYIDRHYTVTIQSTIFNDNGGPIEDDFLST